MNNFNDPASPPATETVSSRNALDYHELHRRFSILKRARYRAADRLAYHHRFSQWTVSMLSVGLIFITVWPALDLPTGLDRKVIDVAQIGFAVLVLVYSLLLSMENYMLRSDQIHRCAMEIDDLDRTIQICKPETAHHLLHYSQCYKNILDRSENHIKVDYLRARLEDEERKGRTLQFHRSVVRTYFRYLTGFAHYAIAMIIELWFIFEMVRPLTTSP